MQYDYYDSVCFFLTFQDLKWTRFITPIALFSSSEIPNKSPWSREQFRCVASQWETSLHCNNISHWLGTHLDWSHDCRYHWPLLWYSGKLGWSMSSQWLIGIGAIDEPLLSNQGESAILLKLYWTGWGLNKIFAVFVDTIFKCVCLKENVWIWNMILLKYLHVCLLQWCHNECNGIWNHWHIDCFLNHLLGTDQRKHQSSMSLAFENVSIWWRSSSSSRIQQNTFHMHNILTKISQMYSSGGCQRSSEAHQADNWHHHDNW